MIVRWLGAFRKGAGNLHDSLLAELTGQVGFELAAEPLQHGKSFVPGNVGLLAKRSALVKKFTGDVWSERHPAGNLEKTRRPAQAKSRHEEAWIRPDFAGIVVVDWGNLGGQTRKTVEYFAKRFEIPVFQLQKGKLKEVDM